MTGAVRASRLLRPAAALAVFALLPLPAGAAGTEVAEVDDPRTDGWSSEVFGAEAQEHLSTILGLLERPADLRPGDLEALITPDFTTGPLRPRELAVVFSDPTFTVERPAESARKPGTASGAKGLVRALRALAEPLDSGSELRHKVKTIRVSAAGERPATRHLVSLIGTADGGLLEQHATWDCSWSHRGEGLLLNSIVASDFERSRFRQPGGRTLFVDNTEAVLGGNRAYADQLMGGRWQWMSFLEVSLGTDIQGHSGLAIGDADGDGLEDLYSCQVGGLPNLLFLQQPDGTAVEVAAEAGVDWMDRSLSALFVDLDGDGDQDLVVGTVLALLVMENDGGGRFSLRAAVPEARFAYSLAAADYDADGDLDLYATRYSPGRDDSAYEAFVNVYNPYPYHDANNGAPNAMLENRGDFDLRDVTAEVGLDVDNRRWSFAATWEDYDNDGDPDLYVANDFGRNCLYRNDAGRFTNVAAELGVEDAASGMAAVWGDYDRDGWIDLFVSNMFSSAGQRITTQERFQPAFGSPTRQVYRRFARGNSLFRNREGRFEDVSEAEGVTMGRWAWGSVFADLNNDGWEDLVVANGFLTSDDPHDL